MKLLLSLLVLVAGMGNAVQTGMNMQLRNSLGHGIVAIACNFIVGLLALLAILVFVRVPLPSFSVIADTPLWAWFGGLFGAFLVVSLAVSGKELGGVLLVVLFVAGQLGAALVLDHYGWLGFPERPVTPSRILGCVLLITSLVLFKE
jgi:transporter family-2 protein